MSTLNSVYSLCPTIRQGLPEAFGLSPFVESLPFSEFVNSDLNRRGIVQTITPGRGKKRTVELSWFPRLPESQVVSGASPCGPFDEIGDNTKEYSIGSDPQVSGEKFSPESLATFCEDNGALINQKMAMHMDVVDRKVATLMAQQLFAQAGKYSTTAEAYFTAGNVDGVIDADNNLEVPTKLASGEMTAFLETIELAAKMSGFNTSIIGFGGAAMEQAYRRAKAGCCTNSGIDMMRILELYGTAFAYDKRIAAAFGGNNFSIITQPGAIQLLSYQLAGWKDGMPPAAIMGSNYVRFGAFTRAGVPVDVLFKDDCPGEISMSVTADVELITLPDNLFYAEDEFSEVNYVAKVEVKNA